MRILKVLIIQVLFFSTCVFSKSAAGNTALLLKKAAAFVQNNMLDSAVFVYKQILEQAPLEGNDSLAGIIKARIPYYEAKVMEVAAKKAVAEEDAINVNSINDSSLAVIYFKNTGSTKDYDPLEKGLADMIITDLSQISCLKLVERTRMNKIMDEIGLDMSGVTVNANRIRVAKLSGASKIIAGVFSCPKKKDFKIKAGFLEIKSRKAITVEEISGDVAEFFKLEKKLVFAIIEKLGVKITDEERKKIETIKTENMLAFMAYCKAVDACDRGDYSTAQKAYAEAYKLDPNFKEAGEMADAMTEASSIEASIAKADMRAAPEKAPLGIEGSGPAAIQAAAQQSHEQTKTAAQGIGLTLDATGSVGRRMASLAGASFMPEMPVTPSSTQSGTQSSTQNESTQESGMQENEIISTIEENTSTSDVNVLRTDYSDYLGLGFGSATKQVPVIVKIPQEE